MKTAVIYNATTGFIRSISLCADDMVDAQAAGWGPEFAALDVTDLGLSQSVIAANLVSITFPNGYAVDIVNKKLVGGPDAPVS